MWQIQVSTLLLKVLLYNMNYISYDFFLFLEVSGMIALRPFFVASLN